MMEKLIACCGLDCAVCEARIATVKNDDELRKATAEKWKTAFNSPDIDYRMINCTGCMEEGVKIVHCGQCEVRNCVIAKGFGTCAECDDMETCTIVAGIHKFSPDAKENLRKLIN